MKNSLKNKLTALLCVLGLLSVTGFMFDTNIRGGNGTFTGTLNVAGASTLANTSVVGTLGVTGAFSAGSFSNNLSVFAATTSAQLAGIISDEVGSGPLAFVINTPLTNPTIDTINQKAATAFALKDNTGGTRFSIPSGGVLQSTLNNTAIGGGSTGTFSGDTLLKRLKTNQGTTYIAADGAIVPSAGWGTTAAVSGAAGSFDQSLHFSITPNGTGIAANPPVTITFKDGTFTAVPTFVCARNDNAVPNQPTGMFVLETATTLVITPIYTPVAGSVYSFRCIGLGN